MAEPLNLTHLRSLVTVVDRRSFTRAAQVLHLSQSTVSQHIFTGRDAGPGRRGRLRLSIGSTEYAADQVLPRLLRAFRRTFGGYELSFVLERSAPLVESVRRGDLDLAVILATTPDAPGTRAGSMKLRWLADEGLTDETLGWASRCYL